MLRHNKTTLFLFLSLLLGSFSDEAAQMIFALNISNTEQIYLTSLLLLLGMLGGIIANTLFSRISAKIGIKNILFGCLMGEALLILLAALIPLKPLYLCLAFLLGVLGGMLWSAVLVMIPLITKEEAELNFINKYAHFIRNMGFMVGPILGGGISSLADNTMALWVVGLSTLIASFMIVWVHLATENKAYTPKKAINGFSAIANLLADKKVRWALIPLMFTIVFTSTLSVLIIVYMIDVIKLDAAKYGVYTAAISLSLAISPLVLTPWLSKLGEAVGACLSAALIGLGLLMLSMTENYPLILFWGMVMGAFNGTQNTIMSAFMLKNIAPEHRENDMPAYVLLLQLCVFVGFLLSMCVSASYLQTVFLVLGGLTIICGLIGAFINRKITSLQG